MFTKTPKPEAVGLDALIDELQNHMLSLECDSKEYTQLMAHLSVLYKMKEGNSRFSISADTKAVILANLAGIVLILGFEKANVVTSKALSFIMKLK